MCEHLIRSESLRTARHVIPTVARCKVLTQAKKRGGARTKNDGDLESAVADFLCRDTSHVTVTRSPGKRAFGVYVVVRYRTECLVLFTCREADRVSPIRQPIQLVPPCVDDGCCHALRPVCLTRRTKEYTSDVVCWLHEKCQPLCCAHERAWPVRSSLGYYCQGGRWRSHPPRFSMLVKVSHSKGRLDRRHRSNGRCVLSRPRPYTSDVHIVYSIDFCTIRMRML